MPEQATVTSKELQEILKQQQASFAEAMKTLATEIRKPNELEQAKLDRELEARRQMMADQVATAKQFEENMRRAQEICTHKNKKGGNTFAGQVCSNGDAVARCSHCGIDFRWKADQATIARGVLGLQDPDKDTSWVSAEYFAALEKKAPPTIPAERIKAMTRAGKKVS